MKIPDKESITVKEASGIRLGTEKTGQGWQCGIYSEETELQLCIFKREEPENKIVFTIPEHFRKGRIYSFELSGELEGLCYCVGTEEKADPFAREYCYAAGRDNKAGADNFGRSRDELYSVFAGAGTRRDADCKVVCKGQDTVLYKLHVRGFTMTTDEDCPGTFKALSHRIPYIKELGMNAVLLMPCYEFHEIPAVRTDERNYYRTPYTNKVNYWGYTDGYYFAPKRAYCAGDDGQQEFADMVSDFHKNGIRVFMEIFFPEDMAPSVALEVLRLWHVSYGVDGFRLIAGGNVFHAAATDIVLMDCILIGMYSQGEGFRCGIPGNTRGEYDRFLWYDEGFMEAGRHFLRGDEDSLGAFLQKTIRHQNGLPTVNFLADQNCLTLMDMVSFERRHNEQNGENNRDGRRQNISMNYGCEGKTKDRTVLSVRQKQVKNALAMIFLSASVPMIMAGDEFGVSRGGNNNPYCLDNEVNYIDWELLERNKELYEFTRQLIAFRREHSCIHPAGDFSLSDHKMKGMPDLSYHSGRAWYPVLEEYSRDIGVLYCGAYAGEEKNVYILYNMHTEPHEYALIGTDGKKWELALTSDVSGVVHDEAKKRIRLKPRTMAVFVSK